MNRPKPRLPTLSLGIAAAAILATALSAAREACVAGREALLVGQIWRLWTAHLVHFSPSHLLWSGAAWLAAASWMEREDRRALALIVLVGAPLIAAAALLSDADMARYGGLSGLACAPLAWIACGLCHEPQPWRRAVGAGLLTLLLVKLGLELRGDRAPLLADFEAGAGEVRSAAWAHVAGATAGLGASLVRKRPKPTRTDR